MTSMISDAFSSLTANPVRYGLAGTLAKVAYDVATNNKTSYVGKALFANGLNPMPKAIGAAVLVAAAGITLLGRFPLVR